MKKSYLEQCTECLPPEKREAAHQAYKDLVETGDGGFLSKLLLVMEANGAYVERIPEKLAGVLSSGLSAFDSRLTRQESTELENAAAREQQFREILLEAVPVMARELSVEGLANAVEEQNVRLSKVERGVSRFRHLRVGGVILLTRVPQLGKVKKKVYRVTS